MFRKNSMKKFAPVVGFLVATVLLAGCASTTTTPSTNSPSAGTQETTTPTDDSSYSLEEVAQHSTPEDCWLAIDGEVYDVSNFVSEHPGGEEILKGCGKDASTLFHGEEEHQGSTEVQAYMAELKIGTLTN